MTDVNTEIALKLNQCFLLLYKSTIFSYRVFLFIILREFTVNLLRLFRWFLAFENIVIENVLTIEVPRK
jgi:hypothetical protein